MRGSESKSKKKIGVSLDKKVVEWIESVLDELDKNGVKMNRSQLIEYILRKIMVHTGTDKTVGLILRDLKRPQRRSSE